MATPSRVSARWNAYPLRWAPRTTWCSGSACQPTSSPRRTASSTEAWVSGSVERRNASAVPQESHTSPGLAAPAPTAATWWSMPPTTTSAPRACSGNDPWSSGPWSSGPRGDPARRTSGSAPSRRPVQPTRSEAHSCEPSSSQPVRAARLRSKPRVPVSRCASQSAALSTVTTRDRSRPAAANARTFAAVARADTGSPVRPENSSTPTVRPRSRASAAPRESCQATSGASGRSSTSSRTTLSANDASPIARTRAPGRARQASVRAARTTSASRSGSISAPVAVVVHGTGAWATGCVAPSPAGEPSAAISSTPTLAAVVPRSTPRTTPVTAAPSRRTPARRPRPGAAGAPSGP